MEPFIPAVLDKLLSASSKHACASSPKYVVCGYLRYCLDCACLTSTSRVRLAIIFEFTPDAQRRNAEMTVLASDDVCRVAQTAGWSKLRQRLSPPLSCSVKLPATMVSCLLTSNKNFLGKIFLLEWIG